MKKEVRQEYTINEIGKGVRTIQPVELYDNISVFDLLSVYYFVLYPSFTFTGETHNYYELWICLNGHTRSTINGVTFDLRENQFTISKPNDLHSQLPVDGAVQCLIIAFNSNDINDDLVTGKIGTLDDNEMVYVNQMINEYTILTKEKHPNSKSVDIRYIIQNSLYGNRQIMKNLTELILLKITNNFLLSTRGESPEVGKTRSDEIDAYIDAHYLENQSLEEMASALYYSVGHLCRKFKQDHGTTIINYINKLKISHSLKLLLGSDSITKIAQSCGFKDSQYFIKVFKQYVGTTPKQYRKKAKSNEVVFAENIPANILF